MRCGSRDVSACVHPSTALSTGGVQRARSCPWRCEFPAARTVPYNQIVTSLLKKAFAAASELPAGEQDTLASQMLREIAWEKKWETALSSNPEKLSALVEEALVDIQAGRVGELNVDDV